VNSEEHSFLPSLDYLLDESDPDLLVLRRQDGTFVAAFSARGATREGIVQAAEQDYGALLRENADHHLLPGPRTEEQSKSA
jgi:hypothetical protein